MVGYSCRAATFFFFTASQEEEEFAKTILPKHSL
jgi:hypothetical protein